ncbi:cytochrome P450 CYP749A22-like protein [Gossypium australe]|uniref:Cytochrome P450 CYP749A22-like protein n=1 Tax=Gossypium australe TaxID=47621 RepID=A0A5B6WWU7_9ROSI|nr:cytochrome P450 CYP749A22-like protein [Gossypium australe]
MLNSQGIKGPRYKFIHGNNDEATQMTKEALSKPMALTHDIFPRVQPHIYSCINRYGRNFLYWDGVRPELVISEPELLKEVLKNSEKTFPKRKSTIFINKLLGNGLVTLEGEKWVKQRKLANNVFHGESLKDMIPAIIASVETMLKKWKGQVGKEIEVFHEFKLLSSEVISRTAFGSSYLEGEKIFEMSNKLTVVLSRNLSNTRIPLFVKLQKPADMLVAEELAKGIQDCVSKIVKTREDKVEKGEADNFGIDFLGLLINAYHDTDENNKLSLEDLVDECKTFYFAGQETVNSLLAWMMTMIINESLRLYGPAVGLLRKGGSEVRLGNLVLPADIDILIANAALHHDPQLWGDDVHLFKPERFAEGIAKATNYNTAAFCPFGLGPRTCVGTSFAIMEVKIAVSMILQRYTISLSPAYVHAPVSIITVRPQHGIQRRKMSALMELVTLVPCCFFFIALIKFLYDYLWIPLRIQHMLNSQGIKGPPYRFIHGNNKEIAKMRQEASSKPMALTHDIFPKVQPHIYSWINKYGRNYLYWNGVRAELVISEPELVKEILKNSEKTFPKRKPTIYLSKLLGNGLVTVEGEKWAKQRKLANYVFHGESLKMTMIINETLRLYGPSNGMFRRVGREVQMEKVVLPANIDLLIANAALHHDPQLWGEDVHHFKPDRFAEGIAKATNYNAAAFFPFGLGPRTCVGMTFATTETKIVLSMILQRYAITLSPAYVHSPIPIVSLKPQHGIQVIHKSLHSDA